MILRIIVLILMFIYPLLGQAGKPLTPFEAHYKVYGKGFYLGTGAIILSVSDDQNYRMHADVKPQGMAAMLFSDQIVEESKGIWHAQGPRPLHYQHERTGGKKEEHTDIRFDWRQNAIHAIHDQRKKTLALEPRMTDPLSVYLLAMWDLQTGHQADIYKLASNTKIKSYQVRYHGKETLETTLGALSVVRVSQHRVGKDRTTTFWFAEKLDYIPVQVRQTKAKKEQLRLVIDSIKR